MIYIYLNTVDRSLFGSAARVGLLTGTSQGGVDGQEERAEGAGQPRDADAAVLTSSAIVDPDTGQRCYPR